MVFEQHAQDLVVERMTGLVRVWPTPAADGRHGKKIADRGQHLVPYELVGIAQALGVEHAVFVHHDRVVEAAAERQPLATA